MDGDAPVPKAGDWPIDPQEDQEIRDERIWIDGCFDFFHHGMYWDFDALPIS